LTDLISINYVFNCHNYVFNWHYDVSVWERGNEKFENRVWINDWD